MSFNTSVNFGFFAQTAVYAHSGGLRPSSTLKSTNISGNIQVQVYPRWFKHIAVQWSVPADWGNCTFNVYFSETEDSGFEKLNAAPIDGTYLLDTGTQEYRKFNRGFYIVEAILLDKNHAVIRSMSKSWETSQHGWVNLRSTEIQRREQILLRKFNGSQTYLFRRKTYGIRCPNCWDKNVEKVVRDNCPVCVGTGFKGGYFEPAPCYVQYDPTPNVLARTYFGKFEPSEISGWTISLPEIRPDDILLRIGDWSVFRIDNMMPTTLQSNPVRQILKMVQLPKSDVENELVTRNLPEFPQDYV